MKNYLTITILFIASGMGWAQNKTAFIGLVESAKKIVITNEQSSESDETTVIEFAARSIKIGSDTYNIINKQFDGVKTSIFRCSKGRGSFVIKFVSDDHISVVDQRIPDVETRYVVLKE